VHAVADVHDTEDRRMICAPLGLGVGWIVQAKPSQCSASGRLVSPQLGWQLS
jgi:hypothetical protein